ncbi:hypothetical protein GOV12_00030 [Candidatus Pacearchaeota archaeon]|nr:hypothetical protein [Candidatus Pacearchaeota archaeon]
MALTKNLDCEDKGNRDDETFKIGPLQFFRAMYHVAKSCFTHPFSSSILEYGPDGKIRTYQN